jgi:two-component system KDP operon response regulator KdpE
MIAGPLKIDPARWRITYAGQSVRLTPTEWKALTLLAQEPTRLYAHAYLAHAIWHKKPDVRLSALHNLLYQVRRKLIAVGAPPTIIGNVPGVGYRLYDEESAELFSA